jgi:superfamily II DNA helicase RecQ
VILIIYVVRDHIILVAVDELHLNARDQWGGKFRPGMAKLHILRQRLPSDLPLLGVSATLTKGMTDDVLEYCGFRRDTEITRYTIYRPSSKFYFEATSDAVTMQKRAVQTIIQKGRE